MNRKTFVSLVLILGSLTALGPFSIDMYLPGFPAIAKSLNTTVSHVSLSLASYFIGISAGQLLYGPLLDRFGRKPPLFIGLGVYILASIGCSFAAGIDQLVALRFIQAIGSCAAAVASIAMVRDLFPVEENAKVFALLFLVVGASPMIAPAVGSYVTAAWGWSSVFWVLGGMGLVLLLVCVYFLPDSYKPDTTLSLKPGPIISSFLSVIREPQFYTYALAGSFAFSGLFAYVAGSPLLFMKVFGLSEKMYGWLFAGLSVGFIGSNQLNTLVLRKYRSEQIVPVALACQAITSVIFVLGVYNGWFGLGATLFLLFIFLSCLGFTNPNTSALSLAPFTRNAGTASALMGAMQLGIGTLASVGISLFDEKAGALPMVGIMAFSSIAALVLLLVGRRNIGQLATGSGAGMMAH
ncbi:multidrug effflux MFS transporter [Chitinophaga horti]|uniref:Multidrug effflux MFS transporter n=1 Tax=Chitinophaga horti TaxID=2920382 RepID=A0ABY6J133_9BACT|nr:multidrug effflux MFS transporter [Chitinophaga horti]UYQ93383.1 multidrug effflux MFS transporter [Chitinophaga horti]